MSGGLVSVFISNSSSNQIQYPYDLFIVDLAYEKKPSHNSYTQ